MLKKKAKRKKRGHTAIGKDEEEEAKAEEEDEIHKIDAATIAANMKKVPLIDKDTRGGGDPNFHGLKEHEEGHQQQKQHLPHSSRFRGVTKHKRSGRWEAHIWIRDTKMYGDGSIGLAWSDAAALPTAPVVSFILSRRSAAFTSDAHTYRNWSHSTH